jgi:predicted AlkP superfamily pyrophosphatase or phosphodiesterase
MSRFPRISSLLALALLTLAGARAAPVLMISIDGMKPEYALEADQRSLKIPYLRSLVAEGSYARGVVGVWPTVTYPSHTTLLTGVLPSEHGITNNLQFDPFHRFADAWYWYAAEVRVPTLWQSAHEAGLVTASIGWPVSVGATDVDYLIPEYWRGSGSNDVQNPFDRDLLAALARPAGLLAQLSAEAGPYMMGNDTSLEGDRIKTRFLRAIIRTRHPKFMTLHLSSLDEIQHAQGPFSTAAYATLESIDGLLSELSAEARAADPATVVVVVSDHGFTTLRARVHLGVAFVKAGLVEVAVDPDTRTPKVVAWRAEPWAAGGMTAVMLKDPRDAATETQVGELLRGLAADPDNGIAEVLDRKATAARGGFPDAGYLVVFKPGYYAGANLSGDLVTEIHESRGGHGFSPDLPEMRASFFAGGRGIAAHRDLGVVTMTQIAPTIARLLGVALPTAKAAPLELGP